MSIDHLEELFQTSQSNMDEKPPKAAWEMLHQKLENHKTRKAIVKVRRLAIAASVLALISIGIVSLLFFRTKQQQNQILSAKLYAKNIQQLSISPYSDSGIYTIQNVKTMNELMSKDLTKMN